MTPNSKVDRILAVDGGGSKTIAWVANVRPSNSRCFVALEVIGRGQAGPSNPRSVGFETAFANLGLAIETALEQASSESVKISVACLSLAGAGRIEEQNQIRAWADKRQLSKHTIVIDDVEPLRLAAMYEQNLSPIVDGSDWEQSVTLVVGTGSIALGRNGEHPFARVGGWGYLLGDEGSGFSMGLAGLRAICQSHDRGEAETAFQASLLRQLGLSNPTELVGFIYQNQLPRAKVAELSEIVLAHSMEDPIAAQILTDSVEAMVQLVTNALRRIDPPHSF
ncbi:MAG TPA: BadF/BadG/BcrA/BcrD ATPase family protein [Pirellula sp.]|nr:BadF/BadG/BcrA/BcrD ATPase family protein [Pirellula sp.]